MEQATQNQERRLDYRAELSATVEVEDMMTGEVIGTIGNLSVGGLMIISEDCLDEGLMMQLNFRASNEDGEPTISVGAQSLWTAQAQRPGTYWTGFKIIDMSDRDADAIEAMIANY